MKLIALMATILLIAACATPSQNVYDYREAGRSVIVEFGTVVDARQVQITGPNTGAGATVAGVAGGVAGSSIGSGNAQIVGATAGAVAGLVIGAMAEQALQDRSGNEFTIVTEQGRAITVVQYFKEGEPIIRVNDRVMVQTSGSYQRVLPANHLPNQISRPKGIKVTD